MGNIVNNIIPTGSIPDLAIANAFDKEGAAGISAKAELSRMTQDVCTSFINNQITSITRSKMFDGTKSVARAITQRGNQMISLIDNYADIEQLSRIAQDVASMVCSSVMSYISTTIITNGKRIISSPDLAYISSQSVERFKTKIMNEIGNVMEQLNEIGAKADEAAALANMENYKGTIEEQKRGLNKIIDKCKDISAKINDTASTVILPWMDEWITKSMDYVTFGPDELIDKLNKVIQPKLRGFCNGIENITNGIEKGKAKAVNGIINFMANSMFLVFKWCFDYVKNKNQEALNALDAEIDQQKAQAKAQAEQSVSNISGDNTSTAQQNANKDNFKTAQDKYKRAKQALELTKLLSQMMGMK